MGSTSGGRTVTQEPTTTTQRTEFPKEVSDLFNFITPQLRQTLEQVPLKSFTRSRPQEIAGLTDEQQQAMQVFFDRMGQSTFNEPEMVAIQELFGTVGAAPGSSPGTLALQDFLENQFQTRSLPSLQNELGLAGLGRSSAMGTGIADLRSGVNQAMVPVLLDELRRRDDAVGKLFQVGQVAETRPTQRASEAFDIGETMRQLQQAVFNAEFAERLRIQDLITGITGAVTGTLLPASLTRQTEGGPLRQRTSESSTKGLPLNLGFNFG